MNRSVLAQWAMSRRVEAYFGIPALIGASLVVFYSFGPPGVRALITPGIFELPLMANRTIGVAQAITGLFMAWTLLLAVNTMVLARNGWIWACTITVIAFETLFFLMWLDGHSAASRASSLWRLAAVNQAAVPPLKGGTTVLMELASIGAASLFFFLVLPLFNGKRNNPVAATLVPERWSIATVTALYGSFWLAYRLQTHVLDGSGGPLPVPDSHIPALLLPLFFYLILLYMARMQYRCWVWREAGHWKPGLRTP